MKSQYEPPIKIEGQPDIWPGHHPFTARLGQVNGQRIVKIGIGEDRQAIVGLNTLDAIIDMLAGARERLMERMLADVPQITALPAKEGNH